MKRKIFALLLVVSLSVFALASCDMLESFMGEPECEHTFSEKWSTDANNHWHAATCEHGENKDSLGAHVDADENAKCDVCDYEVGHTHTFKSEWTVGDEKHWKEATCSHTDVRGEEGLHKDDNTDGICEICNGHVHILDGAGFCDGCNKEVKPVDETDLGSVVSATTARVENVVSGFVEKTYTGHSNHENSDQHMWHTQGFRLGTNGTYTFRTTNQVGEDGAPTGKQEVLHRWIPYGTSETILGVSATTVDGVYVDAMPASYGPGDLAGYLYAISTFSSEYGAEATLYTIYQASQMETASDLVIEHDAENNLYSFSFNVFIVNATHMDDDTTVYNANYYEVAVDFGYADDYTLTSMEIECVCYTSDPGGDLGVTWEEDVDLDYDPVTNTVKIRKGDLTKLILGDSEYILTRKESGSTPFAGVYTATNGSDSFDVVVTADTITFTPTGGEEQSFGYAYENSTLTIKDVEPSTITFDYTHPAYGDKYVFTTTQTKGTKGEIELNDGSEFMPTDYNIFEDEACTTPATSIEILVGDQTRLLYIDAVGENVFAAFFKPTVTVTTAAGEATTGMQAIPVGQTIQLLNPLVAGEYTVTVEALGITRTVSVTVNERPTEVVYDGTFEVTITNNNLVEYIDFYKFTADKKGYYFFFIPVGVGASIDVSKAPAIDYQSPDYDANADHIIGDGYAFNEATGEYEMTGKYLQAGRSFTIYFGAAAKGTFTIGWVYSETKFMD